MTAMPGVLDWLVVGDIALQQEGKPGGAATTFLGGAGARLAAHGAALGAKVGLVARLGEDAAGRTAREALERLKVDLRWVEVVAGARTTIWHGLLGRPEARRVERGADSTLRLDEVPSAAEAPARLTVVSGYSLSVEPARSAALGALRSAGSRGGHAALQVEADLLWWTNARMARKVLEPALAAARSVALEAADARVLFGPRLPLREATRELTRMGPRLVYLSDGASGALLQDGTRFHHFPAGAGGGQPADRYAGPAAFWLGQVRGLAPARAAQQAVEYAGTVRRAGAPKTVTRHL